MEHGQKITQNFLGEHKVITPEQQFLGVILRFFMHLRWPWLCVFFCVNDVEAIKISCISMILTLNGFYSIYAKKRDSQDHLKYIKKLKITPSNCCSGVITLCSPKKF